MLVPPVEIIVAGCYVQTGPQRSQTTSVRQDLYCQVVSARFSFKSSEERTNRYIPGCCALLLRLAINRKPIEGSYSSRRQCDAIAREIAGFGADNVDGIEAVGIYNEWTRADGAPSQGNRDIHRPERSRFDPAFPAAKYNARHDEDSETRARGRKYSHSYSDARLAAMFPVSANISKRSGKGGANIERI